MGLFLAVFRHSLPSWGKQANDGLSALIEGGGKIEGRDSAAESSPRSQFSSARGGKSPKRSPRGGRNKSPVRDEETGGSGVGQPGSGPLFYPEPLESPSTPSPTIAILEPGPEQPIITMGNTSAKSQKGKAGKKSKKMMTKNYHSTS